jgi:T-complex protein 1 subunit gamma
MLHMAEPFLEQNLHPTVIVRGYVKALEDALAVIDSIAFPIDTNDRSEMLKIVNSCIGTKYTSRFGPLMAELALDAVTCVAVDRGDGTKEIDIKKYAKVEKIPGGAIEDCRVLRGVMFAKDVVSPGRMRRRIERPRVLLLDCTLEYKKGENQTNVEITKEEDWATLLKMEEEWIERTCALIIALKPDVVVTEKGLSDLAAHFLAKAGISAIRRVRKTDNNRIARATGATIVNRPEEARPEDIGTSAGLFEVSKLGDEYFSFLIDCDEPKACTIILRGASRDVLNEVERNLSDAMGVARNVVFDPRLLPGGGAVEMAVSRALAERAPGVAGVEQWPYRAVGAALEVIPRTLAQNCGANVIRTLTKLRAKHAEAKDGASHSTFGINGESGEIVDMKGADTRSQICAFLRCAFAMHFCAHRFLCAERVSARFLPRQSWACGSRMR